jgi:large subunit ribosomal protein L35Ae
MWIFILGKFYKPILLIINMVSGKVIQFRRGRHRIHEGHFLIEIEGVSSKEDASKYVGKEVSWTSPGKNPKTIKGKISNVHGNKGVVRAIFEKGLPGQAVTTSVEVGGK